MLTIGERPKGALLLVFMGMDLILKPILLVSINHLCKIRIIFQNSVQIRLVVL